MEPLGSLPARGGSAAVSPAQSGSFCDVLRPGGALRKEHALALLRRSGLREAELQRVWEAADANVDGVLQSDEFACALALAEKKRVVRSLPSGGRAAHSAQLR